MEDKEENNQEVMKRQVIGSPLFRKTIIKGKTKDL
jgi:hypothetical protein